MRLLTIAGLFFALFAVVVPQQSGCAPPADAFYYLEYGVLFRVEPRSMTVVAAGRFHAAAPNVEAAPDGLLWARLGDRRLAGFDPASGKFVAEVGLPLRPYNHIVAANGKAYVTHNTLTAEGFWVSVVDTRQATLLPPIKGIAGLRTALAEADGCVYLATMDVQEGGQLRLYRIDTETDQAREVRREPQRGYSWQLAAGGERVYLVRAGRGPGASPPRVEVLETSSGRLLDSLEGPALRGVASFAGVALSDRGGAWLPCLRVGGGYGIARLDFSEKAVTRILPTPGETWQVLGLAGDLLVYAGPEQGGREGVSLVFCDTREEREVKRVFLPDLLATEERSER